MPSDGGNMKAREDDEHQGSGEEEEDDEATRRTLLDTVFTRHSKLFKTLMWLTLDIFLVETLRRVKSEAVDDLVLAALLTPVCKTGELKTLPKSVQDLVKEFGQRLLHQDKGAAAQTQTGDGKRSQGSENTADQNLLPSKIRDLLEANKQHATHQEKKQRMWLLARFERDLLKRLHIAYKTTQSELLNTQENKALFAKDWQMLNLLSKCRKDDDGTEMEGHRQPHSRTNQQLNQPKNDCARKTREFVANAFESFANTVGLAVMPPRHRNLWEALSRGDSLRTVLIRQATFLGGCYGWLGILSLLSHYIWFIGAESVSKDHKWESPFFSERLPDPDLVIFFTRKLVEILRLLPNDTYALFAGTDVIPEGMAHWWLLHRQLRFIQRAAAHAWKLDDGTVSRETLAVIEAQHFTNPDDVDKHADIFLMLFNRRRAIAGSLTVVLLMFSWCLSLAGTAVSVSLWYAAQEVRRIVLAPETDDNDVLRRQHERRAAGASSEQDKDDEEEELVAGNSYPYTSDSEVEEALRHHPEWTRLVEEDEGRGRRTLGASSFSSRNDDCATSSCRTDSNDSEAELRRKREKRRRKNLLRHRRDDAREGANKNVIEPSRQVVERLERLVLESLADLQAIGACVVLDEEKMRGAAREEQQQQEIPDQQGQKPATVATPAPSSGTKTTGEDPLSGAPITRGPLEHDSCALFQQLRAGRGQAHDFVHVPGKGFFSPKIKSLNRSEEKVVDKRNKCISRASTSTSTGVLHDTAGTGRGATPGAASSSSTAPVSASQGDRAPVLEDQSSVLAAAATSSAVERRKNPRGEPTGAVPTTKTTSKTSRSRTKRQQQIHAGSRLLLEEVLEDNECCGGAGACTTSTANSDVGPLQRDRLLKDPHVRSFLLGPTTGGTTSCRNDLESCDLMQKMVKALDERLCRILEIYQEEMQ
ncbi:unnamed protein product [Amoebophrya sp. A120]|nr:unnamed protein product [Amoebophrya sp. A120]|eukprot:GSA120T00024990001.1